MKQNNDIFIGCTLEMDNLMEMNALLVLICVIDNDESGTEEPHILSIHGHVQTSHFYLIEVSGVTVTIFRTL